MIRSSKLFTGWCEERSGDALHNTIIVLPHHIRPITLVLVREICIELCRNCPEGGGFGIFEWSRRLGRLLIEHHDDTFRFRQLCRFLPIWLRLDTRGSKGVWLMERSSSSCRMARC